MYAKEQINVHPKKFIGMKSMTTLKFKIGVCYTNIIKQNLIKVGWYFEDTTSWREYVIY